MAESVLVHGIGLLVLEQWKSCGGFDVTEG